MSVYDEKFKMYSGGVNPKVLKHLEPNQKVLDIGCSDGSLGEAIKKIYNSEVVGVEISSLASLEASKKIDKVFQGDILKIDIPYSKGYFDVIILADVLEHLINPLEVLKKVKHYLNPNGYIIVSVPNIANWSVRLNILFGSFNYAQQGILDSTHLRFFTFKSIENLLISAGFKIVKIETLRGSLNLLLLQRILAKAKLLNFYIMIDNFMSDRWKTLFAQQFVLKAKLIK